MATLAQCTRFLFLSLYLFRCINCQSEETPELPTCLTHKCPEGFVENSEKSSSTILTTENCCQATCVTHTCPEGFIKNMGQSSSTSVTDSNCCQATCKTFDCPNDYSPNPEHASSTIVTQESCCQPTCKTFDCPSGYSPNPQQKTSTVVSQESCCQATCVTHTCPEGFVKKSDQLSSTTVTDGDCCQPTCKTFACPSGSSPNPEHASSTIVTQESCCQPTCKTFDCPSGYSPNPEHASSTTLTQDSCCQATCVTQPCLPGFIPIPSKSSSTDVTNENCCELTTCEGYTCPKGTIKDDDQLASTTLEEDNCCMKSCSVFECDYGYELISSRSHWNSRLDNVTHETCCDVIIDDVTDMFAKYQNEEGMITIKYKSDDYVQVKCCCNEKEQDCKISKLRTEDGGIYRALTDAIRNPNGCGSLVGVEYKSYHKTEEKKCKVARLLSEKMQVPRPLEISGATGANSAVINGVYDVQAAQYSGYLCWKKRESDYWLLRFNSHQGWFVTDSANKDSKTLTGWLRGEEDVSSPTLTKTWKVWEGSSLATQQITVTEVQGKDDQVQGKDEL